jgi:hypothetical protein
MNSTVAIATTNPAMMLSDSQRKHVTRTNRLCVFASFFIAYSFSSGLKATSPSKQWPKSCPWLWLSISLASCSSWAVALLCSSHIRQIPDAFNVFIGALQQDDLRHVVAGSEYRDQCDHAEQFAASHRVVLSIPLSHVFLLEVLSFLFLKCLDHLSEV